MKLAEIFEGYTEEDLLRLHDLLMAASEDDDVDEPSTEAYSRLAESINQYLDGEDIE